jgi:hypothetical protein
MSDNNLLHDSSMGPKKKKKRFNGKLAALQKQKQMLKDGGDSDSGSECEVNATDVYGPCFKEKWAVLRKQKKLKEELEAQSLDKKDDGDLDSGSK